MIEKPEAYNTNEDKYDWADMPLDPHYVYDAEKMDKYLAEREDYIKQLRYERLMAKAAFFRCSDAYYLYRNSNTRKHLWQYSNQLVRITQALKDRAAKILEGK